MKLASLSNIFIYHIISIVFSMTIVFNLKKLALAMIPLTLTVLLMAAGQASAGCYSRGVFVGNGVGWVWERICS